MNNSGGAWFSRRPGLAAVFLCLLFVALVTSVAFLQRPEGMVTPIPTHEVQSGSIEAGLAITATRVFTDAAGTLSTLSVFQNALGSDVAVSVTEAYTEGGQLLWRKVRSRVGQRRVDLDYGPDMTLRWQDGLDLRTELPRLVADGVALRREPVDENMQALIDYDGYPVVPASVITTLVGSGLLVVLGSDELLGEPVAVYEATPGLEFYPGRVRLWLAAGGVRMRTQEWLRSDGQPVTEFIALALDRTIKMGEGYLIPSYLDPVFSRDAGTDYLASMPFDPVHGYGAPVPEGEDLLYPATEPVSGTFAISSSVFITGTWESGLFETSSLSVIPTRGERYWWVVQVLAEPGVEALIIQGPDSQALPPVSLIEAWPPAWPAAGPDNRYYWSYEPHTQGEFVDGCPTTTIVLSGRVRRWPGRGRHHQRECSRGSKKQESALSCLLPALPSLVPWLWLSSFG